ncbi:phospholipase, partial [Pseudomonas aeruginosa]|nr:phospholipase [Pseudomonas aeruginosa]
FQTAAFQPIDNLATYWFEQFRAAPSLQTIGYALHATGDVAQPHHVWITSANGHSSWEGWVDDHYASEKLNDPAAVANLVGRYDPSKSIRDLLTQTGQVAYARPEPLYDTSYETRLRVAKELIPESIALTVTVLTKGANSFDAPTAL